MQNQSFELFVEAENFFLYPSCSTSIAQHISSFVALNQCEQTTELYSTQIDFWGRVMDQIVFNVKNCENTTQPVTHVIRIWLKHEKHFLMMEIKRDAG